MNCSHSMTAADWIAEQRRIEQAATEGPWRAAVVARYTDADGDERGRGGIYPGGPSGPPPIFITPDWLTADAEFIADARTALPKALDALEAVLALHRLHVCGEVPLVQMERGACFIGHDGCLSVGTCRDCKMPYPCPTVAVITEALT